MEKVVEIIGKFNGAIVALSAGVDSSLVAALARKTLGDRAVAITAVSESLAQGELDVARRTAGQIGISHVAVVTNEVHNPTYLANPSNRCYYCKETLYRELRRQADYRGLEAILDGTQLDDLEDTRPGLLAAREAGVRSPLAEAGLTKRDVREAARLLGLEVWDKPAMPCLSSRIPHGEEITINKLLQVDAAESVVRQVTGAQDVRVRHHGTVAAVEIAEEELPSLQRAALWKRLQKELTAIGFTDITFGPRKRSSRGHYKIADGQGLMLPLIDAP